MSRTVTEILQSGSEQPKQLPGLLFPQVYDELRRLAQAQPLAHRASLRPTDLVHESFLKLVESSERTWENRRHFVCTAALAMRQILIDRARARSAQKHGGGRPLEPLLSDVPFETPDDSGLLAVDAALVALGRIDERAASVVTLRFFLGLTEPQIADTLGITDRTVRRDWTFARSWLARRLDRDIEA